MLDELGRHAYVTPDSSGWIVVYDQQTDEFDLGVLESLALTLSTRLSCTALPSCNADDGVLWLALYENGQRTTRYTSSRESFEDGAEFPPVEEAAAALARIFEKPETTARVSRVLRTSQGFLGLLHFLLRIRVAYVAEIERHQDLATLLGIPRAAVGSGYSYVHKGETPEGVDRGALRRTTAL